MRSAPALAASTPFALLAFALLASAPPAGATQQRDGAYELTEEIYNVAPTRDGSAELAVDLYVPRARDPIGAVVLMHGGAFVTGSRGIAENQAYGRALAGRGYLAAAISYRLHGDGPRVRGWAADYARLVEESDDPRARGALEQYGDEWAVAVAAAAEDLEAAVAWLRTRAARLGFEPDHIALFGASAGAITALTTTYVMEAYGTERLPVAGVISLRGLLLRPDEAGTRFGPDDPPLLILHGEADERVTMAHAEALFEAAAEGGTHVQLLTAPGFGHELGGSPLLGLEVTEGEAVIDRIDRFLRDAFGGELRGGAERRTLTRHPEVGW